MKKKKREKEEKKKSKTMHIRDDGEDQDGVVHIGVERGSGKGVDNGEWKDEDEKKEGDPRKRKLGSNLILRNLLLRSLSHPNPYELRLDQQA